MTAPDELRELLKRAAILMDAVTEDWTKFGVLSSSGGKLVREMGELQVEIRRALK